MAADFTCWLLFALLVIRVVCDVVIHRGTKRSLIRIGQHLSERLKDEKELAGLVLPVLDDLIRVDPERAEGYELTRHSIADLVAQLDHELDIAEAWGRGNLWGSGWAALRTRRGA
jgi:hypothetical protein